MNPYDPIEVTELYARDGMQSSGYSVRFNNTQAEKPEDKWQECGIVSSNYLLVPNQHLRDIQDSIVGMSPMQFQESKVFFDGRHFMRTLRTTDLSHEIRVGDPVAFGIGVYNSYDGSRAASIFTFIEHLVCKNGMVSVKDLTSYRFKHTQGKANWSEETERAFKYLMSQPESEFFAFAKKLTQLCKIQMNLPAFKGLRENEFKHLSQSAWGDVIDRFLISEDYSIMGLLDAMTGKYWHADSWGQVQQVPQLVDSVMSLVN